MAKVKIYSSPTCPYCKACKKFLDLYEIPYADLDVAENKENRAEMIKRSGQHGVPVIDVDGELIIGFDRDRLMVKLGLLKEPPPPSSSGTPGLAF